MMNDIYITARWLIIKSKLPKIRESFPGKYLEMDFSQNIALKTKNEVQTAHFSGKQQSLHCSIVIDENDALSYVYHLSDDTGHDPTFVNEVLNDIFLRWNICNETILLKSDNAPNQYKDKYAFAYYQDLANKYNVRIVRLYGAAGHGKGLIDAMSSFGVKSILRKDIVTGDVWYKNSEEMCKHLRKVQPERTKGDKTMIYQHLDPVKIDAKRMTRPQLPIAGCMKQHLFDYKPGSKKILCKEFLCDCLQCLQLDFDKCVKLSAENPVAPVDSIHHEDEGSLNIDEENESHKVFEFVAVPSFVALISEDSNEPVYILKVEEKERAEKDEQDDFEHCIPAGDLYIRGKYFKKERFRPTRVHKFSILSADALCTPDEIFDVFVDVSEDLTIEKETFRELLSRAGSF